MPDWAEQVTAIATVIFAGRQAREARMSRTAEMAVEFFRRWSELDYFEQLGALELHGAFDFGLIRTMLGHRLIDRWEMWQPSIDVIGGSAAYPMFAQLVAKMRAADL
jgi:hypothetical protein